MRLPLADLTSTTSLNVTMCMINAVGGGEWTYAGVPSDTFSLGDGYDRDFATYYNFNLAGTIAPTDYSPI